VIVTTSTSLLTLHFSKDCSLENFQTRQVCLKAGDEPSTSKLTGALIGEKFQDFFRLHRSAKTCFGLMLKKLSVLIINPSCFQSYAKTSDDISL